MPELAMRGGKQKVIRREFIIMTANEYLDYIRKFPWTRQISEVHGHHTFQPNVARWKAVGSRGVQAQMYAFHTGVNPVDGSYIGPPIRKGKVYHRNWSDFGQHGSIMPDGTIGLGRDLNRPPASASGYNGNSRLGPVMFENVADLRKGHDYPPTEAQWETFARVGHGHLKLAGRPMTAVRWHDEMQNTACPGDISKDEYIEYLMKLDSIPMRPLKPTPPPVADPVPDKEDDAIETPWEGLDISPDAFDLIDDVLRAAAKISPKVGMGMAAWDWLKGLGKG